MIVETERLLLREFDEDDWPAVLAYQSDPRYLRYTSWHERSEAEVRAFVERFRDWQRETPRTRFQLAVVLRSEGRLIGNCGIRIVEPTARGAETGYELDPRYWGRGYATEAAGAMLAFGFEQLGLHRVAAECVAENAALARVLEKLGLRREARLVEQRWMKGRWWDTLLYAILDREWHARPPGAATGTRGGAGPA